MTAKTFLVVDDSAIIRKISRRYLEARNIAVTEAADGRLALDACLAAMPDAILLDWNMPVMDGLEMLKALRILPGGNVPVVIFCTTENEFSKITQALESGANEFIMKPFDDAILYGKLEQLGLL